MAKPSLDDEEKAMTQDMMSDDQFNELLYEQVELHRKYFVEKPSESFMPQMDIWLKERFEGEPERVLVAIANMGDERFKMMHMLGAKFYDEYGTKGKHPVALFFTSEAWTRGIKPGEDPETAVRPSQSPDRQEVLITAGLTIDQRTNMAMISMERDKDNNIVLGGASVTPWKEGSASKIDAALPRSFYEGYARALFTKMSEKGGQN